MRFFRRRQGPAPKVAPAPAETHVPVLEPETEPVAVVPEPEPEVLAVEPEPPQPEPVTVEPEPVAVEPEPEPVGPRAWNIWELDRLAKDAPEERREELAYLLVYLRDFASPEGVLPDDFDELVRESFGELIAAGAV